MRSADALPLLVRVAALQPALALQHAEGYGALGMEALERWRADWQQRAILMASGSCALVLGLVLAGMALMLHVVTADGSAGITFDAPLAGQHTWVLVLVPLLPLLAAAGMLARVLTLPALDAFAELRLQARADLALLDASTR